MDEIKEVEKLYILYCEIPSNEANTDYSISLFNSWYSLSLVLFDKYFNSNDIYYSKFIDTNLEGLNGNCKRSVFWNLSGAFKVLISKIKDNNNIMNTKYDQTKVFIVHGHDEVLLEKVKNLILTLGLDPIVLNQEPNAGNSLLGKLEKYSNVGFAIILYTPCDEGKAVDEEKLNLRARQNVVFEHGYLLSKLGRQNIAVLRGENVEMPSDISGIAYVNGSEWKYKIADELIEAGYKVDKNKIK